MRRTMDTARINALANHPEIRPFIGGEGALDLTSLVENPSVVTLLAPEGAFVLVPLMGGVYELHTMWLPEGRGRPFFGHAREMFRHMFCDTDCLEVVTKVPDPNRAAAFASAKVGFRERFRREGVSFRSLDLEGWALRDDLCRREGEFFHDALEDAKRVSGADSPIHPDDSTHDAIVGAALHIAYSGNLQKAVDFYNGWGVFAGYGTIAIVGPNLVDIGDAVVEIRGGKLGVLRCQSVQHSRLPQSAARS